VDRPAKVLRIASALAVFSFGAAASAGEIGPTSSATAAISLTVAPHVDVREIMAAAGPAASGGARTYRFCVSANTPTRLYGVTLAASEGDSSPEEAPPLLDWASGPDASNRSQIRAGGPATTFIAAARRCAGESNAALIVTPPTGQGARQSFPQTLLIVPE